MVVGAFMERVIKLAIFLTGIFMLNHAITQDKLHADQQIPVVAWSGIPAQETSVERFAELKEMGITINLCNYPDIASVEKALDIASQAVLKMITSCPELKTDGENTVRRLMKHPALEGYFLKDEPVQKDFAELGEWAKKLKVLTIAVVSLLENKGKSFLVPAGEFAAVTEIEPGDAAIYLLNEN